MIVIDNHRIAKRTIVNIPQNPTLKAYARKNRFNMNFAEISFWMHVNKKKFYGLDFNRQFVIGNYIADFYIRSLGVAVEIDGAYHNDRMEYDQRYGFAVMFASLPRPAATPSKRRGDDVSGETCLTREKKFALTGCCL